MCGILCIIDQNQQPIPPEELQKGIDLMAHRGPDAEGTFFGEYFAFGHRRLAILNRYQAR